MLCSQDVQYRFVLIMKMNTYIRGFVKLKIDVEIREKLGLARPSQPPPPHPFNWKHVHKKTQQSQKKHTKKIRVGA